MDLLIKPANSIKGEFNVPGDKSISHRAVMFGALAEGVTEVENFLMGEDCLSTLQCFNALGIASQIKDDILTINGQGLHGLQEPLDVLNVGNSGTTIRLMMGILAGQTFFTALTGDHSIRRRPMARVAEPLKKMGAQIFGRQNGSYAPVAITGTKLDGLTYSSPVASAQVKSAILLAGLFAEGQTIVEEPFKSRDHTERMLNYFGGRIEVTDKLVTVCPEPELKGRKVIVPGDISSAAFFMVAGLLLPNSEILIKNVGVNPTRDGIIEVLKTMGGNISLQNESDICGEPVADILVKSSHLKGTAIGGDLIPRLIDEIPILTVAAALAEGQTIISGASELKVKETNRIATIIAELNKFGVVLEELSDGIRVVGRQQLKGTICASHGDHRIAMAMAIAGLLAQGETTINNAQCIDISFPGFYQLISKLCQ